MVEDIAKSAAKTIGRDVVHETENLIDSAAEGGGGSSTSEQVANETINEMEQALKQTAKLAVHVATSGVSKAAEWGKETLEWGEEALEQTAEVTEDIEL